MLNIGLESQALIAAHRYFDEQLYQQHFDPPDPDLDLNRSSVVSSIDNEENDEGDVQKKNNASDVEDKDEDKDEERMRRTVQDSTADVDDINSDTNNNDDHNHEFENDRRVSVSMTVSSSFSVTSSFSFSFFSKVEQLRGELCVFNNCNSCICFFNECYMSLDDLVFRTTPLFLTMYLERR